MFISVIILAAGKSLRIGGDTPKQFLEIDGKKVISYSLETFKKHPSINEVILVMSDTHIQMGKKIFPDEIIVRGGDSRKESALNGLKSCNKNCSRVLIHDAARPFVSNKIIDDCIKKLNHYKAVTPVVPIINTLIKKEGNIVKEMPERSSLFGEQTPQGFHYKSILDAHKNFSGQTTDDIRLIFSSGIRCSTINGHENNFKITTEIDLKLANLIAKEIN